ncbi:MAG: hypothetical protein LBV18_06810 [Alistipes sp.]|jgi:hypothetical protein|nr:hypothetical protein [Alistipes sp.]
MKKLISLALAFAATTISLVSCGDPENGGNTPGEPETPVDNKFTFADQTYDLTGGKSYQSFYGDYYGDSADNIYVDLWSADGHFLITLDMLVAKGGKRLTAGTYTFDDSLMPGTFTGKEQNSAVWVDDVPFYIVGGTVTVGVSGSGADAVYTVAMDCTVEDAEGEPTYTIEGEWRGKMEYVDETVAEVESGEFTVDGTTYDFAEGYGSMGFYGDYYDNDRSESISLYLNDAAESTTICIDMLVPSGEERLVDGTYTFGDSLEPFTFTDEDGYCYVMCEGYKYHIVDGAVEVSVSNTGDYPVYTIELDCALEDAMGEPAGDITGSCKGPLSWDDNTAEDDVTRAAVTRAGVKKQASPRVGK